MTNKINKINLNVARLTQVRDWLRAGAPHEQAPAPGLGFNMGAYFETVKTAEGTGRCGTTCCIAGAAVAFDIAGPLTFTENDMSRLEDERVGHRVDFEYLAVDNMEVDVFDRAQELLGLNGEQATELFNPLCNLREITPREAADAIDRLIETGEVEWECHAEGRA